METRNIFDVNLPNLPKSGSISIKKDVIAQNEGLLAEKKATLAKLKKHADKLKDSGRDVDEYTLKTMARLQDIIRNTQQRIDREKERLAMLINDHRQY